MELYVIAERLTPNQNANGSTFYHTPASAEADLYKLLRSPDSWTHPWSFFVRPATWREREAALLDLKVYEPPVWKNERFWRESKVHKDHFAHVSLEDPSLIAFTESEAKGEQDRQTRMKPGKYLKKYFGDVLSAKQIAYYAEWWSKGSAPPIDAELKFASEADEIVSVYDRGPISCMKGKDCVRVYGAGDLAVAYLQGPSEQVIARALCWPERKTFGRVYPSSENWRHDGFSSEEASKSAAADLETRLKQMGYTSLREDGSGFDGARVLREPHRFNNAYVMPYLDYGLRLDHGDGEHFLLSQYGEFESDRTDGIFYAEPQYEYTCDRCDEGTDDIWSVYTGWRPPYGPTGRQDWCESCRDNHSFRCDATDEDYDSDEVDSVVSVDGETWVLSWAQHNAYYCDHAEAWVETIDDPPVYMANGETWSRSAFEADGYVDDDGLNQPRPAAAVHPDQQLLPLEIAA